MHDQFPHPQMQASKQYLLELLSHGVRKDGRMPDSMRHVSLNVGEISSADGSSLLRYGETVVMCGVKLELVSSPDSRTGYLVCNVDCGSSCLPEATGSAPSMEVQAITKQIQLLLTRCINLENMVIPDSEFVWVVNVDVLCLNHDGNLLDAATLSAMAALKNVKVPILSFGPKVEFQMPIFAPVFSVSFVHLEDWLLLDPCLEEEKCANGHLSLSVREDGTVVHFQQLGYKIDPQKLLKLSQLAMKKMTLLNELLHTSH